MAFRVTQSLAPSDRQLQLQAWARSPTWLLFTQLTACYLMVSIALEHLKPDSAAVGLSSDYLGSVAVCLLLLAVDNGVQCFAIGARNYYANPWGIVYSAALVLETLSTFALGSELRLVWLRVFRVVLVLCKLERFQPTMAAMLHTFTRPRVLIVLAIFFICVAIFALYGQIFYGHMYRDLDTEYTDAFSFPTGKGYGSDGKESNAPHFFRAAVSLFILSTDENYPGIAYPAMFRGSVANIAYFATYIILTKYLILNVLLAATYNAWKSEHSSQLLEWRLGRYHSLLLAWHVLFDDAPLSRGGVRMDERTFMLLVDAIESRKLVNCLSDSGMLNGVLTHHGSNREQDRKMMFAFMDRDRSGFITKKEFILHVCDALSFDFGKHNRLMALQRRASNGFYYIGAQTHAAIVASHGTRTFVIAANMTVALAMLPLLCRTWVRDDGGGSHVECTLPAALEASLAFGCAVLFTLEQAINLIILPSFECWPAHKQIDLLLSTLYIAGTVGNFFGGLPTTSSVDSNESNSFIVAGPLERLYTTARILLVLRFLTLSFKVRQEMATTWRVRFAILNFVMITIVVIYTYACVGVSLMHGHLSAYHTYDADPGETYFDDASVGQSKGQVNTYGDAFLVLMQETVDNNWQDLLWANVIEAKHCSSHCRAAVGIYFVSFFVVMGWFGLNILTALVIETYVTAKAKEKGSAEQAANSDSFDSPHDMIDAGNNAMMISNGSSSSGHGMHPSVSENSQSDNDSALGCTRCGPGMCARYVPARLDPYVCQCGHAVLYHRTHAVHRDNLGALPSNSNPGSNIHHGRVHDAHHMNGPGGAPVDAADVHAGWSALRDNKVLERADDVPQ